MPDINALTDAVNQHAWPIVAALVILFAIYAIKLPAFGSLWSRIPATVQPLIAVGLGIASGVAEAVSQRRPWLPALVSGVIAGLSAIGVDQVQSKVRKGVPSNGPTGTAVCTPAFAVAALAAALAFTTPACIPAKTAASILNIIDDAVLATDMLDSAWSSFCTQDQKTCSANAAKYERLRGILLASLRAAKATTATTDGANTTELREAYSSVEALLLELGAIRDESKPAASHGYVGWVVRSPFREQK